MASTISGTSNIDVSGIVSQLMQIEQRPMDAIKTTISGIQTQISAWGKVQSALATLQGAARTLTKGDTWSAATATSSDDSSVAASAGRGAIAGSYSIEVARLANRQTVASNPYAAADTVVGEGTLRIQMGTLAGAAFTADPGRPEVAITIAPNSTLAQVRDAINAAGAGVTASLVADGTGQRLMVRSADTGAAQAFSIAVDDPGASGLSALAYDPGANTGLLRTQTAQDASVTVNGLTVTAPGNHLEGVIENVTLDLKHVTTAPVDIGVASDAKAVRGSIDTFVKAYNDLNKLIADQTRYDPATKVAGTLQGNQVVVRVQQQMRELLRTTIGSGPANSLSAIGVELQRDGSLAVNESKMSAALASPDRLKDFFASTGATPEDSGLAQRLVARLGALLDSQGTVTTATDGLNARQKNAQAQQDRLQARLNATQARLTRQYTALDANLSRITGSFAGIEGMLNNLNNGKQ